MSDTPTTAERVAEARACPHTTITACRALADGTIIGRCEACGDDTFPIYEPTIGVDEPDEPVAELGREIERLRAAYDAEHAARVAAEGERDAIRQALGAVTSDAAIIDSAPEGKLWRDFADGMASLAELTAIVNVKEYTATTKSGARMVITVRRETGRTPLDMLAEARTERDTLRTRIAELERAADGERARVTRIIRAQADAYRALHGGGGEYCHALSGALDFIYPTENT